MASDEQRVRTVCGWIGVEIGKCRVRTQGKAGYGLWRVRGTAKALGRGRHDYSGPWTAYAFTLDQIFGRVMWAIQEGVPTRPGDLVMHGWDGCRRHDVTVPTRWTQAYRGRRDLGLAGELKAARALVGAGLEPVSQNAEALDVTARAYQREFACEPSLHGPHGHICPAEVHMTAQERQRAANAAFQAEHAPRREAGLVARHAAKLGRNAQSRN